MSTIDEAHALEQVIDSLLAKFPSIDPAMVRAVVDEVHQTFDGPVRDYVPLLVQRASTDRLRSLPVIAAPTRPRTRRTPVSA